MNSRPARKFLLRLMLPTSYIFLYQSFSVKLPVSIFKQIAIINYLKHFNAVLQEVCHANCLLQQLTANSLLFYLQSDLSLLELRIQLRLFRPIVFASSVDQQLVKTLYSAAVSELDRKQHAVLVKLTTSSCHFERSVEPSGFTCEPLVFTRAILLLTLLTGLLMRNLNVSM